MQENADVRESLQIIPRTLTATSSPCYKGLRGPAQSSANDLSFEKIRELYDDQQYFPSPILSRFGTHESVSDAKQRNIRTKLRHSLAIVLYCIMPLNDILSDAIMTGFVS